MNFSTTEMFYTIKKLRITVTCRFFAVKIVWVGILIACSTDCILLSAKLISHHTMTLAYITHIFPDNILLMKVTILFAYKRSEYSTVW